MPDKPERRSLILPDRPIYYKSSRLAYLWSLFVHAFDESVEFFRTDWRAVCLGIAFPSLGLWFSYFVRGKAATVTDAQSILVTTALPPFLVALALYLLGIAKAPYLIHEKLCAQLAATKVSEATANADIERRTLPDRLNLLAQEIVGFVEERERGAPSPRQFVGQFVNDVAIGSTETLLEKLNAASRSYDDSTMRLYAQDFANRVIVARDEIRRALPAEEIGDYSHPSSHNGMRAISEWLADKARQLA
jgi:hypothetical protein